MPAPTSMRSTRRRSTCGDARRAIALAVGSFALAAAGEAAAQHDRHGAAMTDAAPTHHAPSLSLGHVHHVGDVAGVAAGLGLRGSIAYAPPELERRYGTRAPLGVMAFVQVQPTRMTMGH